MLWNRYGKVNTTRFETKQLLDKVEKFQGLPTKAAANNLLESCEGKGVLGRFDRLARTQQQYLLHSLRVQAKVLVLLGLGAGGGAPQTANALELLAEYWAYRAAAVA